MVTKTEDIIGVSLSSFFVVLSRILVPMTRLLVWGNPPRMAIPSEYELRASDINLYTRSYAAVLADARCL